jgi:hypothetical protein
LDAVIDIHPYDMAELLMESKTITFIKEGDLIRIGDKLYRQTTAVPQKGTKIS